MILSKASNCAANDATQAASIGLQIMAFSLGHYFVTRLKITETLLTQLTHGKASQYVATFKTTEALL